MATTGWCSSSCSQPSSPGSSSSTPSSRSRATDFGGADKQFDFGVMFQRLAGIRQQAETHVDALGGTVISRDGRSHSRAGSASSAMPEILTAVRLPGTATCSFCLWVCRPRTRLRSPAGRISTSSPTCRLPSTSVPVTTVPKPGDGEDPVDRQARPVQVGSRRAFGQAAALSWRLQLVDARARAGRNAHDRRICQHRIRQHFVQVGLHQVQPYPAIVSTMSILVSATTPPWICRISRIARCSRGLGHNAFIGGDDEQGRVDAAHARQHILDEIAVPGHIDNADLFRLAAP